MAALIAAAADHCAVVQASGWQLGALFMSPTSAEVKRGFEEGITCSPSFWTGTPSAAESGVKVETERRERGKVRV